MSFSRTFFSNLPNWEENNTFAFNELILSWNGIRPKRGKWTFWVSLKEDEWLKIAEWAHDGQKSFKDVGAFAQSYQDVVTPKERCTSFKIKVEGDEISQLHRLNVCLSNLDLYQIVVPQNLPSVFLTDFPRQSQQILPHPRSKDLCSPTSTSTAISYLCKRTFDPVQFANRSHDAGFNIYGNWILNVAEAYNQSGHFCHVERLADFSALHHHLMGKRPVVVSIKGPIAGARLPYAFGHLMCVIGFDGKKVYCMDSAFPDNESTFIGYDLMDFLKAWSLRKNLAYVFN